jgi:hypothetical protein
MKKITTNQNRFIFLLILYELNILYLDPDVDGRRWIFRKWKGLVGTGWRSLRIGTGGGHL